jgi:hypothetical protein
MKSESSGDHSPKTQQRSKIENVRSNDDPGPYRSLVVGERRDRSRDLRRVGGECGNHSEQGLRKAHPLTDALESGNHYPTHPQADNCTGDKFVN